MADFRIHDPGDAGLLASFDFREDETEVWQGPTRLPSAGDRLFGTGLKAGPLTVGEVMGNVPIIGAHPNFEVLGGSLTAQKSSASVLVSGGRASIAGEAEGVGASGSGAITAGRVKGGVSASGDGVVNIGGEVEGDVSVHDDATVTIGGRILGSVSMLGGTLEATTISVPKQDDLPGSGIGIGEDASLTAKSLTYKDIDGSLTSITSGATLELKKFTFNQALADNNHIEIIGGGEMTLAGALLLGRASTFDSVRVTDPDSRLSCGGLLTIGDNGNGVFHVESGATVDAGRVVMAARPLAGGSSFLNVSSLEDEPSVFNCDSLDVAVRGKAAVFIGGGGAVNTDVLRIGVGRGSDGGVVVSGFTTDRAELNVKGDITVGEFGLGLLQVGDSVRARNIVVAKHSQSGSDANPSTLEVDEGQLNARKITVGEAGFGFLWVHEEDARLRASTVDLGEHGKMTAVRDGVALVRQAIDIDAEVEATAQLSTDFTGRIVVGTSSLAGADPGSITVAARGIVKGDGMIYAPTVDVAGILRAEGGTLQVNGTLTGTGVAQIAQNSTLACQFLTELHVAFTGARGTLELDSPSVFAGTIDGFSFGDALVVGGRQVVSHKWVNTAVGSTLVLRNADSSVLRYDFSDEIRTKLTLAHQGSDTTLAFTTGNGGSGADTLLGSDFNDTIAGRSGADTIAGFLGADLMSGGTGGDVFVFNALAESGATAAGRDTIGDFDAGAATTFVDRIDLRSIDAKAGVAGNQQFAFIGADAFDHAKGELRVFQSGGSTIVAGDANGDAVADFQIELTGRISLTRFGEDDFLL